MLPFDDTSQADVIEREKDIKKTKSKEWKVHTYTPGRSNMSELHVRIDARNMFERENTSVRTERA